MITRHREQAINLAQRLIDLGADVYTVPLIKLTAPKNPEPLNQAIRELTTYSWLLFTSANGVDFFFQHLNSQDLDARALHHIKIATIGINGLIACFIGQSLPSKLSNIFKVVARL